MSTYVYAFIEFKRDDNWMLADGQIEDEEYNGQCVPKNVAPDWWGKSAYADIFELSGENGFPDDLSSDLECFIHEHWKDANRPSWLFLSELNSLLEEDNNHCPEIDLGVFPKKVNPNEVRLIFWADQ